MSEYAALIGIDWADQKHDICLIDLGRVGARLPSSAIRPRAIDEWALALRARFGGQQIAVCLEQSRGPLIYALLKYDFLTLYPVNPSTLARYREAFSPSRHKDDSTDAAYLAELLLSHRDHLRAWQPGLGADAHACATWSSIAAAWSHDRTRISNRMTSLLKCYFPQVLDWFPHIRTTLVCDFLLRWPSLGHAAQGAA